jgi:hypothetical protein
MFGPERFESRARSYNGSFFCTPDCEKGWLELSDLIKTVDDYQENFERSALSNVC